MYLGHDGQPSPSGVTYLHRGTSTFPLLTIQKKGTLTPEVNIENYHTEKEKAREIGQLLGAPTKSDFC